ncbi:hypothetical protein BDV98DRAFT_608990 [Pterulicium gracile]|uniref:SnoaL-like domain-containing protein n=1 Tax=Pterulicium gracile TaxID=1884261 RepID=A0A5C3Q184_9AGAR|nr:hypothetical protein BDV98DRAFT_608990 [Pterula gracilis]
MPYTQTNFAVDYANITDTINRLWFAVDVGDWVTVTALFAEEVVFDYTAVIGGEVQTLKGDARITFFQGFGKNLDKFHHAISALSQRAQNLLFVPNTIVIDLPQPPEDKSQPAEIAARFNSNIAYVQESAKNGSVMNAGGFYEFKLTYTPDTPSSLWNIIFFKAQTSWFKGNSKLLLDSKNA